MLATTQSCEQYQLPWVSAHDRAIQARSRTRLGSKTNTTRLTTIAIRHGGYGKYKAHRLYQAQPSRSNNFDFVSGLLNEQIYN